TLGQPNWLAAYLVALLPLSMIFALRNFPGTDDGKTTDPLQFLKGLWWLGSTLLFFTVLIFTRSRSGLFAFAVADIILWVLVAISTNKPKRILSPMVVIHALFAALVFFNGSNIPQIDTYF